MLEKFSTQYDEISNQFLQEAEFGNDFSKNTFYSCLDFDFKNKVLLDVCCADGTDLLEYASRGAIVHGLDASEKMLALNRASTINANLTLGLMEDMPFSNDYFDIVVSKYSLQISNNIKSVLAEITRVLKPGGIFAILVNHPFRQFLEKNYSGKDYFLQEVVETPIFEGKVVLYEPSHTFNEYLSPEFLSNFRLLFFQEYPDFPGSRRIDGDNYPCFFILKAQKLASV